MNKDEGKTDMTGAFHRLADETRPDTDEKLLLQAFRSLNRHGRAKAVAYVSALAGLFPDKGESPPEASLPRPAENKAKEDKSPDFIPALQEDFPVVRLSPAKAPEKRPAEEKSGEGRPLSRKVAQKIAGDIAEAYGAALLGIKRSGGHMNLSFLLPANLQGDELFSAICSSALDAAAELFKYDEPQAVSCLYKSPSAEGGLRLHETVTEILLSKPLAIGRLSTFRRKAAQDYHEILRISDEYFIHPVMRSGLKTLRL